MDARVVAVHHASGALLAHRLGDLAAAIDRTRAAPAPDPAAAEELSRRLRWEEALRAELSDLRRLAMG